VFGPQWESAVMPTQILVVAGAATVVIDAVGSVLSAEGRARALLGYGIAHFVAYAGAVLLVASHGIAAVAVAASTVHTIFLVVAYQLLVKGREESALKLLWGDISAALVGSAALFAAALPVDLALVHAGAPAPVQIVLVCPVAAVAYLGALRLWFPAAWGDVMSLARRVLPLDRLNGVRRRTPVGEAA